MLLFGRAGGQSAKTLPVLNKQFSPRPRGLGGQLRLGYWLAGWIDETSNDAHHHRYTVSLPVSQLPYEQWPPRSPLARLTWCPAGDRWACISMSQRLRMAWCSAAVRWANGWLTGWLDGWTDVLARSRRRRSDPSCPAVSRPFTRKRRAYVGCRKLRAWLSAVLPPPVSECVLKGCGNF